MTLEEAIETQETYLKGEEAVEHSKLIASMKLGLEALKWFKQSFDHRSVIAHRLLPGETED